MREGRRGFRRVAGALFAGLGRLALDEVEDARQRQGRRWPLVTVLSAVLVGCAAACRGFRDLEELTEQMGPGMRRKLGLRRRLPDTTARDIVCTVDPDELRRAMHRQIHAAHRQKALAPDGPPFGVVAIDGRSTRVDLWDEAYAQKQPFSEGHGASGQLRTLTACLSSASTSPCIDAVVVPPSTNEMGAFPAMLEALREAYGRTSLFRLITADAGLCSLENAQKVIDRGWDYLLGLKETQPTLLWEAKARLGSRGAEDAEAETEDVLPGTCTVHRRLYSTDEMEGFLDWSHLRTVVRVQSEKRHIKTGEVLETEDRYYVSSLARETLTREQWLSVVRRHWRVENHCHHVWDRIFREDERPWVRTAPRGAYVVMLLRRMAYNLLALFRGVTQRSEEKRLMPWRVLKEWVRNTLVAARPEDLERLRRRSAVANEV